jgi:hypothetical protein
MDRWSMRSSNPYQSASLRQPGVSGVRSSCTAGFDIGGWWAEGRSKYYIIVVGWCRGRQSPCRRSLAWAVEARIGIG